MAIVMSRLEKSHMLYLGLPLKATQKLQLVQIAAVIVLTGARQLNWVILLWHT